MLAIATLPVCISLAHAQTLPAAAPSASSPPAAAMTKGAPPPYRSALEGYKPYTDEKTVDWKQANDNTGKIGGWREYAKEAQQADTPDAGDKPAPSAKPAQP
jgi:hypothetical protein